MTDQIDVSVRPVAIEDVAVLFEHQTDSEANRMAAFTSADPTDREAFDAKWERILADDSITKRTVLADGRIAGHVACFERMGVPEITYWIGREHRGRGVATAALMALLREVPTRPLHARVAWDNAPSIRVLEKCGFRECRRERAFAAARGREIEEIVFVLE